MAEKFDNARNLSGFFDKKEDPKNEKTQNKKANSQDELKQYELIDQIRIEKDAKDTKKELLREGINHFNEKVTANPSKDERIAKSVIISDNLEERLKRFCFEAWAEEKKKVKQNHVVRQAIHDFLEKFGY